MKIYSWLAAILFTAQSAFAEPSVTPLKIAVSIPPQEYIAREIGGDLVEIMTLVDAGQSPATYEITPKQMAALSGADLYFKIGVPFEKNLAKKIENSLPDLPVIDCAPDVALSSEHETGGHGHNHGSEDSHVWLDPLRIPKIARIMMNELVVHRPSQREYFQANYNALEERVALITNEITEMLETHRGKTFYVFHPAFGSFAKRFGLHQDAIEQDGKEPGGKYLAGLIERMKKEKVKHIYVQPQFSKKSARAIADEIGAELIELDPLARDIVTNLKSIAVKIVKGFESQQ